MRFDFTRGIVYVRQSWLNDLVICPERARFKLAKPTMSGPSDATIMGTALHHGIEQVLAGADASSLVNHALEHWEQLKLEPYKTTNLDPEKAEGQIRGMSEAFINGILPEVTIGGDIEHKFSFPLGMSVGDWGVWCEGTMDYIDPNGVIWDWKTASRSYYAKEKQAQSIQATVYAAAAVQEFRSAYPVDFRYGVMVRQEKPKSQIVYMERTASHQRWLMHIVEAPIMQALRIGVEHTWTINDTSALCSDKWCDYWSLCKGAYLSPSELSLPYQGTPVAFTPSEPQPDTIPNTNQPQEVDNGQ